MYVKIFEIINSKYKILTLFFLLHKAPGCYVKNTIFFKFHTENMDFFKFHTENMGSLNVTCSTITSSYCHTCVSGSRPWKMQVLFQMSPNNCF